MVDVIFWAVVIYFGLWAVGYTVAYLLQHHPMVAVALWCCFVAALGAIAWFVVVPFAAFLFLEIIEAFPIVKYAIWFGVLYFVFLEIIEWVDARLKLRKLRI